MYDQRLDTAVANRIGKEAPRSEAWIEIKPYTEVVSVKTQDTTTVADLLLSPEQTLPREENASPLLIDTQNIIDRALSQERYDAIVYATGYERGAWVNLLKDSDIAPHFGLSSLSRNVRLVPTSASIRSRSPSGSNSGASTPSDPSSAQSSPPTSPEMGAFATKNDRPLYQEVHISRNYRLLPTGFAENPEKKTFAPRIYLQGVEEQTHGLSDTLLSVLGVRAGEVVHDLTHST